MAQIVKLKPEHVEEYKKCHAKVWPEVLKQIKDSNIEDCELFCRFFAFYISVVAFLSAATACTELWICGT